jgi:hypothetical protein
MPSIQYYFFLTIHKIQRRKLNEEKQFFKIEKNAEKTKKPIHLRRGVGGCVGGGGYPNLAFNV